MLIILLMILLILMSLFIILIMVLMMVLIIVASAIDVDSVNYGVDRNSIVDNVDNSVENDGVIDYCVGVGGVL